MFGRLDGEGRDTINMPLDKLAQLVLLARAYDAQTPESDPDEASNASDDGLVSVLEAQSDNSVGQELREAIESLSDDEQAVLVALHWIGRATLNARNWKKPSQRRLGADRARRSITFWAVRCSVI